MRTSKRLILLLVACALACREAGDPVREALDRLVKAAQARDAEAVVENLTPDFRDAAGGGVNDARALLRRYFAAYEILDVRLKDVTIERAPAAARARFRADLSGQPRKIGGLDGLIPSASTYNFDVRLVPDGKRWKVAWASWEGGR